MPDSDPEHNTHTRRSARAWSVLLITTVIGLVSDLWSKYAAFEHVADYPVHVDRQSVLSANDPAFLIPPHDPVVVFPSILEFTLVLNPGAVFGIGAGKRVFFVVFTIAAIALALTLFTRWTRPKDTLAHIGFGLIISGGLGNLYDRLKFACVRDFIHPLPNVQLPFGLRWPGSGSTDVWPYVSNIADLYLIVGVVILLIFTWTQPHTSTPSETVSKKPDPEPTPDPES